MLVHFYKIISNVNVKLFMFSQITEKNEIMHEPALIINELSPLNMNALHSKQLYVCFI